MGAYIGEVPAIFQFADMQMRNERTSNVNKRRKALGPRTKEMPRIESSSTIQGPLRISKEYEEIKLKQKKQEKDTEKAVTELNLAQLLAKKTRLENKLSKLNPSKKRDIVEIARINVKLRHIDENIEELKEKSGITDFNELKQGSRLSRFWETAKEKYGKVMKRVKKWYKKHKDAIDGVLTVALPIVTISLFKNIISRIFKL